MGLPVTYRDAAALSGVRGASFLELVFHARLLAGGGVCDLAICGAPPSSYRSGRRGAPEFLAPFWKGALALGVKGEVGNVEVETALGSQSTSVRSALGGLIYCAITQHAEDRAL